MPKLIDKGTLSSKLKIKGKIDKARGPVWAGPESAGDQGGVTQSLLGKFLVCPKRFGVHVIEGLRPIDRFEAKMEFGNMWHAAEEGLATGEPDKWNELLTAYGEKCVAKYPLQQEQVYQWWLKAQAMFPQYVRHWEDHPDMEKRKPFLAEEVFHVPYQLPSGRIVYLRGKMDSVDYIPAGPNRGIWLHENKTKTEVSRDKIERQLKFDLQTMLYLIALDHYITAKVHGEHEVCKQKIAGVRYNVVKRSSHKVNKNETPDGFCKRLEEMMQDEPNSWLGRWNVMVTADEVARFQTETLDPVLENLCDWYCSAVGDPVPAGGFRSYRMPFGVYNPLIEGGFTDTDHYLDTGDRTGLREVDELFPELKA